MHFFIVKLIPDVDILNSIKTLNIIYIKQTNRPNTSSYSFLPIHIFNIL